MKRFKAFTLTEILTGMMLQAGFVIVLMGAFYMLVNFQSANTKLITAREKGQRVLAYIENRVIHAGLGLWKCGGSDSIRNAFADDLKTNAFKNLTLPVAVTNCDTNKDGGWANTTRNSDSGVYRGNVLTVLYAMATDRILDNNNFGEIKTISDDIKCSFLDGTRPGDLTDEYAANEEDNLRSYKVTASSGAPLYITKFSGGDFNLTTKFTGESIDIASGSELLDLHCEKMYVYGDAYTNSLFARVRLKDYSSWRDNGSLHGAEHDSEPKIYENDILDIYFELDTNKNMLDCYVLSSGGWDPSLDTPFPKSWPDNEVTKTLKKNWSSKGYNHHDIYVSRASWKLYNVKDSFSW